MVIAQKKVLSLKSFERLGRNNGSRRAVARFRHLHCTTPALPEEHRDDVPEVRRDDMAGGAREHSAVQVYGERSSPTQPPAARDECAFREVTRIDLTGFENLGLKGEK